VSLETRKSFLVLFFKKEQKKKNFFFEKKQQKTFVSWAWGAGPAAALTRAAGCWAVIAFDHVMIDPLCNQAARLVQRRFGVVDAVERRAAFEGGEVFLPAAPQLAIGRHHRPLATPTNLNHARLQMRITLN
jgi:hypothetical protein